MITQEFKVLYKLQDGRLIAQMETPPEMIDMTQAQVRDIFMGQDAVVNDREIFEIVGFEMQGMEDREVGISLGLLLKFKRNKDDRKEN